MYFHSKAIFRLLSKMHEKKNKETFWKLVEKEKQYIVNQMNLSTLNEFGFPLFTCLSSN